MSRLFLPARTNYQLNPSFELDTNSDGTANGVAIPAGPGQHAVLSLVPGRLGGYAQRVENSYVDGDTAGQNHCTLFNNVTVVDTDQVTVSGWVRVNSLVGCSMFWNVNASSGVWLGNVNSPNFAANGEWTRYSVTYSTLPAGTTSIATALYVSTWGAGDSYSVDVDDIMVEKAPYLMPYFDGSYTDERASWSGTAHASTSVAALSVLTFNSGWDTAMNTAGTIAARVVPLFSNSVAQVGRIVYAQSAADQQRVFCYINSGTAYMGVQDAGGATSANLSGRTWAADSQNHLVGRWSASTIDLNFNGVAATQAAHARVPDATKVTFANSGSAVYVGPIVYSAARKSDAWVTAIQANDGAAYSNLARLKTEFMEPGDKLYVGVEDDNKLWTKGAA